jgi:integrase
MICSTRVTVHQLFDLHYAPAKLARKSRAHRQQMRLTLDRLQEFFERPVDLDDFTLGLIDGFRAWRSDKASPRYVEATTLNKDLRNLRALANFAHRRGFLAEQLFFEFEEEFVDDPLAWFPDELARIFASAAQERGSIGGLPAARFWQALPATIYSTGARIGAVMQLRREFVDLDRGLLTLKCRTQKQRKGQVLHLHPETVAAIEAIWLPERELMFPWPYDQQQQGWPTLTRHYKRILLRAGLPIDSKRLFHCLRKTTATCIEKASDRREAQRQLGHSTEQVTARYIDQRHLPARGAKQLIAPPPVARDRRQLELF